MDTIDKANGYSIFESVNESEMMSVYAKEDTKYADMVDGDDSRRCSRCRDEREVCAS